MSERTFLYLSADTFVAANHLLNFSALDHATERTTVWHAGAECIRVELTTPYPSTGELILWEAFHKLADGYVDVNLTEAREFLDADNYDALVVSLGLIGGRSAVAS